jgi:A/G-specific adenine glycosylase
MKREIDTLAFHNWFRAHRRAFPWRENPTPYRVWISEVMLQQTRTSVVIPYFERWMQLFPDVYSLAGASLEQIIKAWEGLGYYNRARHLHEGAKQIVRHFDGTLPSTKEELEKIKGLGSYTVNAILSFAFHQRIAPVDGNVMRVLSRYFLIEEDISKQATKRKIQEHANWMLDEKKPWVTAEALIELGATVCHTKPFCDFCPLQNSCQALKQNRTSELPFKAKESPLTILVRSVAVIEHNDYLLLRKEKPGKVMADLYEFPYFEGLEQPLIQYLRSVFHLEASFVRSLPFIQHRFTRYAAHLFPIHLRALKRGPIPDFEWVHIDQIHILPFSAGHRRILESFLQKNDPQLNLF